MKVRSFRKVINSVVAMLIGSSVIMATSCEDLNEKETGASRVGVMEVEKVNEILPAPMWDGYSLASVDASGNDVTLSITKKEINKNLKNASSSELKEFGVFMVSNFEKAYLNAANGGGGEGDEEMFIKLNPILKSLVDKKGSLTIKVKDMGRETIEVKLSSTDVKKALETDM